ncbi:nucleotidyl transferase [Tessaracoccus sp. ZS01]|nr:MULTISPECIES: sugar phosphate nucleotidyltransferase [unclassified Tessaracoccus]MBB1510492.1 NTP transferase domain-containing protein [Tessaracoccus sp. MC1756]MCG6567716.1 nucleotidyl transferase [Tessaracoccus sp. ZS01]
MAGVTKRELLGVVLAAGEGRRLRPLTDLRPKPLCPVGNRPLLDWALDRVRPHVSRTAVNAYHLAGQIDSYLQGTGVTVSHEAELLGSAGALGHLAGWIGDADVLLHNSDSWLTDDLSELVAGWSGEYPRLLVAEAGDGPADFGPWRFVGVSLLPHRYVAALPDRFAALYPLVWGPAFERGELEFVRVRGDVVDCGTPADYLRANLLANGGRSVVGDGAVVEGTLIDSVVWPACTVGADEVLRQAVRADGGLTVDCRPGSPAAQPPRESRGSIG